MLDLLYGKGLDDYLAAVEEAGLPAYMAAGVYAYVEERARPGDFLAAVLRNDFKEAVGHADGENGRLLREWAIFLTWCIPGSCSGSRDKVTAWLNGADGKGA